MDSRKKAIAFLISAALIIIHILSNALIINHYPGMELGIFGNDPNLSITYFSKVYIKPWCRVGPFAIGILFGYFISIHKNNKKLTTRTNLAVVLFSLFIMNLMLFGTYPNTTDHKLSRVVNTLYQALSRNLWALGLGLLVYSCVTNGGVINRILSLSIWTPLSRLSYAIYLIHFTIITYYVSILDKPFHLQDSSIIYIFLGNMSFSIVAAYFVSMIFEVPLIGLEKFLLRH